MCFVIHFRRIRELNENNTKKFIEERKRQAVLQSRQMEGLQKIHAEQMENLIKDAEKVIPPCEKYWYEFNDVGFICLCGYQFNLLTAQVFFPT